MRIFAFRRSKMKLKKKTVLDNVMAVIVMTALALAGCSNAVTESATNTDNSLPAPTNLRAELDTDSSDLTVILTWMPVSGAAYYEVYQSTDSNWATYVSLTSSTSSTTYKYPPYSFDAPLKSDTTYYYRVGARKGYGTPVGKLSEAVEVHTGLSGITGVSANALSESSIKVTWNALAGASKYRVYRGPTYSATNMMPVAYIDAPAAEYTDTELTPGTYYYYRIAAIDSSGRKGPISSNYDSATTQAAPTVTGISASALSDSSIKVTWNAFTGASKYRVYRGTSSVSANMEPLAYIDAPATEYTDTGLTPNTYYYYRIAVIDSENNEGLLSNSYNSAATQAVPTVTGIYASALSGSSIKVTWDAFTGASKYRVYRGTSYASANMEPVAYIDAPTTEYTDTALTPGATYYYRIAVIDSENSEGRLSSDYDYASLLPAPANLTAAVHGRVITLEWEPVAGASTYYIYGAFAETGPYAFVDSFGASLGVVYNVTTLTQGSGVRLSGNTVYYFKVAAGNGGLMSAPASATTGP
jgi:fibronectin type 3 domain-containing protein